MHLIRFATAFFAIVFAINVAVGQTGKPHVSSSNSGSDAFSGIDINVFVGADRFYNAGYTGTSALLACIEGGQPDASHNAMVNVTNQIQGTGVPGTNVNHAAAATHAMSGSLGATPTSGTYYGYGVAYGSETWSGDIATGFNSNGSYQLTWASIASPYAMLLQTGISGQTVDVFNSSWGFSSPAGTRRDVLGVDGLINQNRTIGVFSAGNDGPSTNTVGGMAAGYNSISVGALGTDTSATPYGQVTSFSSRGANEFSMATGANSWTTISAAVARRAAIDIVAPGQNMTLASPSGGSNWYGFNWQGTSFAAPTVAGGAGLVVDVGKSIYGTSDAIDGRVVKSVLLNAAEKLSGWTNGQSLISGVITTDQALDFEQGAGRLDLNRTFDQYVNTADGGLAGTTDVSGLMKGDLGDVSNVGWDYGEVDASDENLYFIDEMLAADSDFLATLTWFVDRNTGSLADFSGAGEQHFADLNLRVFEYDDPNSRNIIRTVAESVSLYNAVEHLSFSIDSQGYYGIGVEYDSALWNFTGETSELYGLSWSSQVTVIPEPGTLGVLFVFGAIALRRRSRKTL